MRSFQSDEGKEKGEILKDEEFFIWITKKEGWRMPIHLSYAFDTILNII